MEVEPAASARADSVHEALDADYLVVGAGTAGMAFLDTLLRDSDSTTAILVDQLRRPGGHWNFAYDFVQLHHSSAHYGVNSTVLGDGTWGHRASKQEILAYYDKVLEKLLATGRLRYFPRCRYTGSGSFISMDEGPLNMGLRSYTVQVRRREVDATYLQPRVPAMSAPRFSVEQGSTVVPPNSLPDLVKDPQTRQFVVLGTGKTGMDAARFLLDHDVPPSKICWVRPHEPLLTNRADEQSPLVLDEQVEPNSFRCAQVGVDELVKLRRLLPSVIRQGRVTRIQPASLIFENGSSVSLEVGCVVVDCTGEGIRKCPVKPIFSDTTITLQLVLLCVISFSAALIAKLEVMYPNDDVRKNKLAGVIQHFEHVGDVEEGWMQVLENEQSWEGDSEELSRWVQSSRLHHKWAFLSSVHNNAVVELIGWQGYFSHFNGPYCIDSDMQPVCGRAVYRGKVAWVRLWYSSGAWRLGSYAHLYSEPPYACTAYVESDAAHPRDIHTEAIWMEHRVKEPLWNEFRVLVVPDFSVDPNDFEARSGVQVLR